MTSESDSQANLQLFLVVASGLVFATWSHYYDLWQLPPRFDLGTVGLTLGGDVLPMLVGPVLMIRFVLREPLARYGWRLGSLPGALRDGALAFLPLLPFIAWLSTRPEFQAFYPSQQFPPARQSGIGLAVLWALNHAPQMFSVECLFRGYLLLPLARRFGFSAGLALMLVPYVVLHLTKPPLELMLATVGGVAFSLVAWKRQSFFPAFVAHWLVAASMDALCFLQVHATR